ncbi:hypothetical protein FHS39_004062 [Streptomyces olivoverticillatus]|uniref:Secreted protein n=1 Tax=Streptomyces olivoverticillatus TaxID=66427 RepID=A0A7W7PNN2_9ACTN|nr:hypothetical protein [Streptomyces olivoverticillatus]
MQPPAGHESLPHTRPRPVHWLATAAALAALITGAALLGPGDTTATATTAESAEAPDARTARYPVDCGGTSTEIVKQAPADLDGDGRPETAAVVRCASGAGTRPSGLYVLAPPTAGGGTPRVLATLVDPREKMSITSFKVVGDTVSATLLGYSAASVPRCCPDLRRAVEWRWKDGKFALTALPVAGSV